MSKYTFYFQISEIEKYLDTLKKDEKIEYLISLRDSLIDVCYHTSDKDLKYLLDNPLFSDKSESIPYYKSTDFEQTHISRSVYINFLRYIDGTLLPFVRNNLKKLDKNIKEDIGKIIKDYPVFDFNHEEVLDFSETLKHDKIAYLEWILKEYINLCENRPDLDPYYDYDNQYQGSLFKEEITKRIAAIKRYPKMTFKKFADKKTEIEKQKETPLMNKVESKKDPILFEFNFEKIKEHLKSFKNPSDTIFYLEFIKKEAKHFQDSFIPGKLYLDLINSLDIEIEFYSKKLTKTSKSLLAIEKNDSIDIKNKYGKDDNLPQNNIIKMRWKKENVLLPYLFKVLFEEGFISETDYKMRHKFIEQSFNRKNGLPFTFKISDQTESNYKTNIKTNHKPKNAFMIDKVISNVNKKSRKK